MKFLDGRNPHKNPKVIEIENPTMKRIGDQLYLLILDGKYVPCVHVPHVNSEDRWILCGEYRSMKGVNGWREKHGY